MSDMPMLNETYLIRAPRPYTGAINPGDVFAWEPDIPPACCLLVVDRVEGGYVYACDLDSDRTRAYRNTIERFREAVIPTRYRPQGTGPMAVGVKPPPGLFGAADDASQGAPLGACKPPGR